MSKVSKILLVLLCFSMVIFPSPRENVIAQTNNENSRGLIISPPIQEIEVTPGKNYTIDFDVENDTTIENLETNLSIETFKEGELKGSANVVPFEKDRDYSVWLNIPPVLQLKKGVNQKVSYSINIPENTDAGAYFFAIVYAPKNSSEEDNSSKIKLQSRIASLLFVNVKGDTKKEPILEKVSVKPTFIDVFFDKIDISYDVKVKGSSFYRPVGNTFLIDEKSDTITTISSIVSENLILPNGSKTYTGCLNKNVSLSKCNDTSAIDLPIVGKRDFEIRLDYNDGLGSPQSVTTSRNIIFFPYKTVLILFLFILLVFGSIRILKLLKHRKKEYANK
jgi:hypothetical protein